MESHPGESPQGEKGNDPDWETDEAVTKPKMEPGKESRLEDPVDLKEKNGTEIALKKLPVISTH